MVNVVVYTRVGCHLCDDAIAMLEHYGIQPTLIDIDTVPELQTRFSTCVPVVEINGKLRFRGRVNEVLLRRELDHAS